MTREEAIEILKAHHMWTGEPQEIIDVRKENKALEMAIQALSQEPCDDAVSRGAVDELSKELVHTTRDKADFLCHFWEGLQKLPPVTQKSGKWIKIQSGDKDFPESIVCSKCGSENSHLDFNENAEPIGKVFVTSKYCPNCGARMVEPQESEDKE